MPNRGAEKESPDRHSKIITCELVTLTPSGDICCNESAVLAKC